MPNLLARLLRGSRWGLALAVGAGCSGNVEPSPTPEPVADAAQTDAIDDDADAPILDAAADAIVDAEIIDTPVSDGRPLIVEGTLRLSPLVARSDWGMQSGHAQA